MSKNTNVDELRQILKDTVKHHNDGPTPRSFCNEYDDCDHIARIEELIKQRELALLEKTVDRVVELADSKQFGKWTQRDISDFFVSLGAWQRAITIDIQKEKEQTNATE